MNEDKLNKETHKELDRLVERVARKFGYTDGERTYKEHLQIKIERNRNKLSNKIEKYRHKFSLKPGNQDFTEELRTYLSDGLRDLMAQGLTEDEALRITMEKFDEAELKESFGEFMKEFEEVGWGETEMKLRDWYVQYGEIVGLFYGAFLILGITSGALVGFLVGHTLKSVLIGLAAGGGFGIGFGLLSNALFMAVKSGKGQ